MDIVVGSLGGLKKLFDEGYLRKGRVVEVGIDEVDSMLDDTFRFKSQHCAEKYLQYNPADLVLKTNPGTRHLHFCGSLGVRGKL